MKLKTARVTLYRNFIDSGEVAIDPAITCLVGKNESGKTAFIQALNSLRQAFPGMEPNIIRDYPRWRKVRDEREDDLAEVALIEATFELEDIDRYQLAKEMPFPLPSGMQLRVTRTYGGSLKASIEATDENWIEALLSGTDIDTDAQKALKEEITLTGFASTTADHKSKADKRTNRYKQLSQLENAIGEVEKARKKLTPDQIQVVHKRLPTFFYFSAVNGLDGRVDLTSLQAKAEEERTPSDQTALALLSLAGVTGTELQQEDFEVRIAELEAAAAEISNQVFEYWSQNPDLLVQFQTDAQTVANQRGHTAVHRYLDIRLNDLRHQMTTNFSTRSTGFQWFFSFIVAFSKYAKRRNVIILLDEPGLGLHAKAQQDLLRFIEEKLASGRQVIYTNHSPFMVNPKRLERVRLVEDLTTRQNPDAGARVSADVLSVRGDTLFPLQAALGYDLAQNLFVGPYNLVIEGPADLLYLTILSDRARTAGRTGLGDKITLVPVGGSDKIPTFIALLGAHVDVSVLVDAGAATSQRLQDMIGRGLLQRERLVSVGQVTGHTGSDIEDLFEVEEYLAIYNTAFGTSVTVNDIPGDDPILRRIERAAGGKFDHLRPAVVFAQRGAALLGTLSEHTTARFDALFDLINGTFSQ